MAKLGLPYLNIAFIDKAISRIGRSERGILAIVIKETKLEGTYRLYTLADIPEGLSEKNKEQVEMGFMGYQKTPKRIELFIVKDAAAENPKFDPTKDEVFKQLETIRWDYLAIPFIDDEDSTKVSTWVKTLNDNLQKRVKVVLPNQAADSEKVINFTIEKVKTNLKEYKTNEYLTRIAGLIAGTPMQISCTYAPLPELVDCTHFNRTELAEKIGKGEFVLLNDGEKIKVARGVNSLVTTTQIKSESFKKIKIIDIMDAMADDIQITAQDEYIGKYANSYDNKILLMSAILGYMQTLENDGLLAKNQSAVDIDIDAQKAFLREIGYTTIDGRNVDEMDIKEIKEADTKDKVFLQARCKILDAIEEIDLKVVI